MSNSSGSPAEVVPRSLVVAQIVCYSIIMVVGFVGNLLLIMSIIMERRNKSSAYLVMNLACADFLTCAVSIPLDIAILLVGRWPFGALMCKIVYPLQTFLLAVSVATLLCMSFERHRAIVHPFKRQPKRKTILWVCAVIWATNVIIVSPYVAILKYEDNDCIENWPGDNYPRAFTLCVFLVLFAVPLTIITAIYTRVGLVLRQDSRRLRLAFGDHSMQSDLPSIRDKTNVSIMKKFICAVVAFALCLSPLQVVWMWADFGDGRNWSHFTEALTFANVIVYSNSVINPFIFGSLARRCRIRGITTNFEFVSSAFRTLSSKRQKRGRSHCACSDKVTVNDVNAEVFHTSAV